MKNIFFIHLLTNGHSFYAYLLMCFTMNFFSVCQDALCIYYSYNNIKIMYICHVSMCGFMARRGEKREGYFKGTK